MNPVDGIEGAWRGLVRAWDRWHCGDERYAFMWEPAPPDEAVVLDCETTGLDVGRDQIISVGAVRIVGDRLLTSERLELLIRPTRALSTEAIRVHGLRLRDLQDGLDIQEAMARLLRFIGSRPLVGYYLEFDLAMIHRAIFPWLGVRLPQRRIEVSALYHDWKHRQLPPWAQQGNVTIDLRFATLMRELDLPERAAHDALNDAVMTGLAWIKLRRLLGEGR